VRKAFVQTLIGLAEKDDRILLLTGDLGFMALEPFAEKFPDRFFNVGVAEQNMVGLASGLAREGFIPYVYSIVPFAALRPLEFIRNGPIYHRLPVRIVGIGAGFDYGNNGLTHYGIDDIGTLRCQPGIALISPCDHQQAVTAFQSSWDLPGPVYYRLSKDDKTVVPGLEGKFALGRAEVLRPANRVAIVAMGTLAAEAVRIAEALEPRGISCGVAAVASLSPAPTQDLADFLRETQWVVTLENHYVTGGLGSLAAEIISESGLSCRLLRCGVESTPDGRTGTTETLHRTFGLDADAIVRKILEKLA
jgi:transketolase